MIRILHRSELFMTYVLRCQTAYIATEVQSKTTLEAAAVLATIAPTLVRTKRNASVWLRCSSSVMLPTRDRGDPDFG